MGENDKQILETGKNVAQQHGNLVVNENKNVVIKEDEQATFLSKEEAERMIKEATDKIDQRISPITDKIDKFEDRLVTDKSSLMTVFGIFASIVTFLSVEIQIFKNVCDAFRLIGFSLGLLASLLAFVLVLHWIANFWINKEKEIEIPKWLLSSITLIFVLGGVFFYFGKDEVSCKESLIFERYSNDSNQRQVDFEKQFSDRIKKVEDELKLQIDTFDKQIKAIPKQ